MDDKGYTIEWKSGDTNQTRGDYDAEPLAGEDLAALLTYADFVVKTITEASPRLGGFDRESVKWASDDLESKRLRLDAENRIQYANVYGAFLGQALIEANPAAQGSWVRTKSDDVAIRFDRAPNGITFFAIPITRVFKQIDQGHIYSIYSYFLSAQESLSAPAPIEKKQASHGSAVKAPNTAPFQLSTVGKANDGSDLVIGLPQNRCCNCGTEQAIQPVESPMHVQRKSDGRQMHFLVNLPYCKSCSYTAGRKPKSRSFNVVATLTAYVLFIVFVLLSLDPQLYYPKRSGIMLLLFTCGVIGTFYWQRKSPAPQTSAYQPVLLNNFRGDPDQIAQLVFRFSNRMYAQNFSELNEQLISKGMVAVS